MAIGDEWKDVLLFQGAEAKLYKSRLLGQICVVKERFKKRYRHPTLDENITNSRLVTEARAMCRSRRGGVDCPVLYFTDTMTHRIYMELIDGITLKEFLDSIDTQRVSQQTKPDITIAVGSSDKSSSKMSSFNKCDTELCPIVKMFGCSKESILEILPKLIGQAIAKLHNVGLVHGDITTSNIMLRRIPIEALESYVQIKNDSTNNDETAINKNVKDFVPFSVTLIDFGLSSTSSMAEDRAVDLYVMERALISSHPQMTTFMEDLIQSGYLPTVSKSEAVAQKLKEVRQRGRKRLMVG